MSVVIRFLTPSDTDDWNEKIRCLYAKTNQEARVSSRFISSVLEGDLKDPKSTYTKNGNLLFMALLDDQCIGMVCLEWHQSRLDCDSDGDSDRKNGYYEVQRLAVEKEYRKRGIGRALMLKAMECGRVHLSCLASNTVAISFYSSISGLVEEGRENITSRKSSGFVYSLIHYSSANCW